MPYSPLFIERIRNLIDNYESKDLYLIYNYDSSNSNDDIPQNLSQSIQLLTKTIEKLADDSYSDNFFDRTSPITIIYHNYRENDFLSICSGMNTNDEQVNLVCYAPGSIFRIDYTLIEYTGDINDFSEYINHWKNNSIDILNLLSNTTYDNEEIYEAVNKIVPNENLSKDEIEALHAEFEEINKKFDEYQEFTKEEIKVLKEMVESLQNIRPITNKRKFASDLLLKTRDTIQKYPTTSTTIIYAISNGLNLQNIFSLGMGTFLLENGKHIGLSEDHIKSIKEEVASKK